MSAEELLFKILDRLGCGAVIIDAETDECRCNDTANNILKNYFIESSVSGVETRTIIKNLLYNCENRFRSGSESWATINHSGLRPLALHAIPATTEEDAYSRTLIVITDLSETFQPNISVLQGMFNLTPSEVNIMTQIALGKTPAEIAQEKGITLWTVRSQLASVFAKTRTRRQNDLVSLVMKASIIP